MPTALPRTSLEHLGLSEKRGRPPSESDAVLAKDRVISAETHRHSALQVAEIPSRGGHRFGADLRWFTERTRTERGHDRYPDRASGAPGWITLLRDRIAQSAAPGSILVTGCEPRAFRGIGPNLLTSTRANRARPSARIIDK